MSDGVWVIGGGVIGSLFAAHLSRVAEVTLLCRRAEHAAAVAQNGIRVDQPDPTQTLERVREALQTYA